MEGEGSNHLSDLTSKVCANQKLRACLRNRSGTIESIKPASLLCTRYVVLWHIGGESGSASFKLIADAGSDD
jgi:hypothetical protein